MDTMQRQREITATLNKWAHEYYVLDNPSVSDAEYDKLYSELQKLEEESGVILFDSPTKRVGGEPIKAFARHEHIVRLFSLDKSVTECSPSVPAGPYNWLWKYLAASLERAQSRSC